MELNTISVDNRNLDVTRRPKPDWAHTYNHDLHQRWIDLRGRTGMSLRKIAPRLGCSYTVIGQYENYRYEGDLKAFERKIRAYLDQREIHEIASLEKKFCKTSIADVLWETFQMSHLKGKTAAAIGPSGTGKTKVALEYQRYDPTTILITASPKAKSYQATIRLLSRQLGITSGERSIFELGLNISDRLNNSGRLLILDEAHFLSWESFESLRSISDETGIGITYLGTPRLYSQMKGDRRYDWDQIMSRISIRRSLGNITPSDAEMVANSVCPGLGKAALRFLAQVAQEPGKLRTMTDLIEKAVEVAEIEGIKVTVELLKELKSLNDF